MASKSLNLRVPRLGKNRHGVFYVRSSGPDGSGKRKVRQQSLGTKDPQAARLLALKFCLALAEGQFMAEPRDPNDRYELDLPGGKAKADGHEDHARMLEAMKVMQSLMELQAKLRDARVDASPQTQAVQVTGPIAGIGGTPSISHRPKSNVKLREALDTHLAEEAELMQSAQTVGEKRILYNEFVDVFGDIYLNQVMPDDVTIRWRPVEFKRPNKKYAGKTLSLARLEKRHGYLKKFFKWAIKGKLYHGENPADLAMATKKEIRSRRRPWAEFNEDDLKKLFGAEYVGFMCKPDWYWIPLMALFSGARLSELADLELARFVEIEGIKTYRIDKADADVANDGLGEDEVGSVKTPDSQRTIPIHSALLELGLWQYVQYLTDKGESHLIPHRTAKYRNKSVGREWGVWVTRCGITNSRKVFHSFRSTAITDLHNSEAGHAAIRRTTGHATAGTDGAHGGYIRGLRLKKLRDTVEMLTHPTVDVLALKLSDPTFSAYFDAEAAKASDPKAIAERERRARHQIVRAERLARAEKAPRKRARAPVASD